MGVYAQGAALRRERLASLLSRMAGLTAVLAGDVCVDVYWMADMRKSELSRETPHFPLPVTHESAALGAGGNVAANLRALGAFVRAVGAAGDDWRGDLLRRLLRDIGDSGEGIVQAAGMTFAYCKPVRCGISEVRYEDPRIDFTRLAPLSEAEEGLVLRALERAADGADVVCVADQFANGSITPRVREALADTARRMPVVVDSRDRIGLYRGAFVLKPNEVELGRATRRPLRRSDLSACADAAGELSALTGARVCVTLGPDGCLAPGDPSVHVPGVSVPPPVDTVGAGDTFLAAFALALAAGAEASEAAAVGNLASSVTVRKIGCTGTATAEEILRQFKELEE